MTNQDIVPSEDDDDVDLSPAAKRARKRERRKQAIEAYNRGGLDVLEQFVPGILKALIRQEELLPKVFDLVDGCIESGNTQGLKEVTPLLKLLLDENRKVLDRRHGTAVHRQEVKGTVTHQHVSLRDLIESRRNAVMIESPTTPHADIELTVDAEEVPE